MVFWLFFREYQTNPRELQSHSVGTASQGGRSTTHSPTHISHLICDADQLSHDWILEADAPPSLEGGVGEEATEGERGSNGWRHKMVVELTQIWQLSLNAVVY